FNGYTLTWDDAGFLQSKTKSGFTQNFYWNARGQLDSVSTTVGSTTTKSRYKYDGIGHRIETDIDGVVRRYWHDGEDLFVEFDGNWNTVAEYTMYPGTDRLHSVKRGNDVYYFATDEKGTVLGLYDDNAAVLNEYQYDPWGRPEGTATDSIPNTLRYIGREWDDAAGLLYLRARYYDPEIGRFISEDPIGLAGGINPYSYALNDPVNLSDRTGLMVDCYFWIFREGGTIIHVAGPFCRDTPPGLDGDESSGGGGGGGGGVPRSKPQSQQTAGSCPALPAFTPSGPGIDENIRAVLAERDLASLLPGMDLVVKGTVISRSVGVWNFKAHVANSLRTVAADYGNMPFGAVMRAAGWPDFLILWGGGAYGALGNLAGGRLNRIVGLPPGLHPRHPGGIFPYGDSLTGALWVERGIDYFDNGCYK
ncbi:MAG: RHS repeat-associated core domain-containing protein, partial [Gemmatimonadetes bacterium]|nr:RHS repeat-associated core domain-containing protein [Gemmatimonadota bacterium]